MRFLRFTQESHRFQPHDEASGAFVMGDVLEWVSERRGCLFLAAAL